MRVIDRSALLPYNAHQIYHLVNDVEAYPQYMAGCVAARVLARDADRMDARLELARGGIRQSFSTRNRLVEGESIALELIEGPFEFFNGRWDFRALGESACKVSLRLEFAVNNGLIGAAAARLFDRVTGDLVDAVSLRARHIYG